MDDRKVRLRIVSVMTDPQGERHETKHARLGALREEHGSVVLTYEDEQDGERAHVVLTASADSAQMRRMGAMSGMLRFEPGVRTSSAYVTVYGEIPVSVFTRRVALETRTDGGNLHLDYDVYVGGEKTSSAEMVITWKA
ncbi:MAG TPA: DUF1934 domain-containing protein [Candidatus Ventricola gallistercoris]|nr:DUF1934 domain-containing protein [Candidatus Ventricola gallistercoris]